MKRKRRATAVLIVLSLAVVLTAPVAPLLADDSWQTVTVDSAGSVGWDTSLALTSDDRPCISYYDILNDDLKYAWWDGDAWQKQTVDSTLNVRTWISLALTSDDRPCISYYDWYYGELKFACWDGTTWQKQTVDSTGVVGMYTSLALTSDNRPCISYHDWVDSLLKYAWWDGTTWRKETVDNVGLYGGYTSLALTSDNLPCISYYHWIDYASGELKYAWRDGTTWEKQAVDSAGDVGSYSSIALTSDNRPCISYIDYYNYYLKYAWWDGTNWQKQAIDSSGNICESTSLALTSDNRPCISYIDHYNYDLKYAWLDGSTWQKQTADSTGEVGEYSSLDLTSDNLPCISYYDETNYDLKYAGISPSLTSITPSSGTRGTAVNVTNLEGSNFYGIPAVELRRTGSAPISANGVTVNPDGTQITCVFNIPADAAVGTWDLYVQNPGGLYAISGDAFTIHSKPVISSLSPTAATTGSYITINGNNFGNTRGSSYVMYGSTKVSLSTSYSYWYSTKIKVKVPSTISRVTSVTVYRSGVGKSNAKTFKVIPKITSLSPTSGKRGSTLTINGTGFGPARYTGSYVKIGGVKVATYYSWSNTRIVVKVPSTTPYGSQAVKVTTSGGTSSGKTFTVKR